MCSTEPFPYLYFYHRHPIYFKGDPLLPEHIFPAIESNRKATPACAYAQEYKSF